MSTYTLEYPYAGLDFMLDKNLNLVFLEANAVPGGIYVMDKALEILYNHAPGIRELMPPGSLVEKFVNSAIKFYFLRKSRFPRSAIVTTPIFGSPLLMPERMSIVSRLLERGIYAILVNRENYFVKEGTLFVRVGSRKLKPDLIIRRNTCFPKNISQPTLNPSEVGVITGSKYRTIRIIRENMKNNTLFRVPESYYTRKTGKAIEIAERLVSEGKSVIVKPNKGEKGKYIICLDKTSDIEKKIKATFHGKDLSLIIQEKIEPFFYICESKKYVFDIRAYAFLGRFVGAHIRRAGAHIFTGEWEKWGISNVSAGGMYVPILVGDSIGFYKWSASPRNIYLFKSIFIDKCAFIFDDILWKKLKYSVEFIVRVIDRSLRLIRGGKN